MEWQNWNCVVVLGVTAIVLGAQRKTLVFCTPNCSKGWPRIVELMTSVGVLLWASSNFVGTPSTLGERTKMSFTLWIYIRLQCAFVCCNDSSSFVLCFFLLVVVSFILLLLLRSPSRMLWLRFFFFLHFLRGCDSSSFLLFPPLLVPLWFFFFFLFPVSFHSVAASSSSFVGVACCWY